MTRHPPAARPAGRRRGATEAGSGFSACCLLARDCAESQARRTGSRPAPTQALPRRSQRAALAEGPGPGPHAPARSRAYCSRERSIWHLWLASTFFTRSSMPKFCTTLLSRMASGGRDGGEDGQARARGARSAPAPPRCRCPPCSPGRPAGAGLSPEPRGAGSALWSRGSQAPRPRDSGRGPKGPLTSELQGRVLDPLLQALHGLHQLLVELLDDLVQQASILEPSPESKGVVCGRRQRLREQEVLPGPARHRLRAPGEQRTAGGQSLGASSAPTELSPSRPAVGQAGGRSLRAPGETAPTLSLLPRGPGQAPAQQQPVGKPHLRQSWSSHWGPRRSRW